MRDWWKIVKRAFRETQHLQPLKIYAALVGVLVPLLHGGIKMPPHASWFAYGQLLSIGLISGLLTFAVLSSGEFLFRLFVLVPTALQRQVEPFSSPFRGEIINLTITNWADGEPSAMSISVTVQIRYFGPDTEMSIHQLQLFLIGWETGSTIAPGPYEMRGKFIGPRRLDFNFNPIPRRVVMNAMNPRNRWKFTFKDYRDLSYESETYYQLTA